MKSTTLVASAIWVPVVLSAAHAQSYPTRPLRIVVPFAASGPADFTARLLGPQITKQLGQNVIVDNRVGANGIIGVDSVAKSPPDGYSMLLATSSAVVINMVAYSKLPFDTLRDLQAVTPLWTAANLLVVHSSLPVKSVKELVALAKRRPGEVIMGSGGAGGILHLALELLKTRAGVDMVHVPYKGGAPAVVDLVGGQTNGMFVDAPLIAPHLSGGKVRALAVASPQRSPLYPTVPTMVESGFAGIEVRNWYGVFLPAKPPAEILSRLHETFVRSLDVPEVREKLNVYGAEPMVMPPAEFTAFVRTEIQKWGAVVKTAGIRIDP